MTSAFSCDSPVKPPTAPTALPAAVAALFCAGTLMLCSGCEDSSPGLVLNNGGESDGNRCDELLNSAVNMLQPERLGISSDRNAAVTMLNDWLSDCAPEEATADKGESGDALLRERLSEEELARVRSDRFNRRGAGHIRNCFLHKATVDFAARSATDDVERIVELFYYVVRNVALVDEGENAIPLTPYEILLLGRGTAEDRAWVFADLLRQIRIDTVILKPGQAEGETRGDEGREWLVGVLLNGKVYLFDPRRGLPVPAADAAEDGPLVRRPATLTALQESTEQKSTEDDSAPAVRGFPQPSVRVIGNTSFWAPRMRILQMALSGDRAAIVYDGLQNSRFGEGLLARVSGFSKELWKPGDVSVWSYPEEQVAGFYNLSDRQDDRLRLLMLPFDAPARAQAVDQQSGQIRFSRPERKQLKTRMEHLLGRYGGRRSETEGRAIRSYLMIRGTENFPEGFDVDPTVRRMHTRAAEDAFYWKALCQFEKGEYEAAVESFRNYLERYQPDGLWMNACRYQLAIALANLDRSQEAVKTLQAVPEGAPQHAAAEALLRRWTESGEERAESGERRARSPERGAESGEQR